jgi:SAM-dependent methyltransferase
VKRSSAIDRRDAAYPGQAVYTRGFLLAYNTFVYRINSPVAWRCPESLLVNHYDENVSARHLDIGVATGLLLDKCHFPSPRPTITLMDLNANSLALAAHRLRRYAPRVSQANVLDPWQLPPDSVDSIGLFNLLHCLPGSIPDKAVVFKHARTVLTSNGVLFGSTILGQGVHHNWLAKRELAAANMRGIMCNALDRLDDLEMALANAFDQPEITIAGSMALFCARSGS